MHQLASGESHVQFLETLQPDLRLLHAVVILLVLAISESGPLPLKPAPERITPLVFHDIRVIYQPWQATEAVAEEEPRLPVPTKGSCQELLYGSSRRRQP